MIEHKLGPTTSDMEELRPTSTLVKVLSVLSAEFLFIRLTIDGTFAMFSAAHRERLFVNGQSYLLGALTF
jgi:hypothetical protein